jgi:hypothetical protein
MKRSLSLVIGRWQHPGDFEWQFGERQSRTTHPNDHDQRLDLPMKNRPTT